MKFHKLRDKSFENDLSKALPIPQLSLKAGSFDPICVIFMILFYYYTETKEIIYESVNVKGLVNN